MLIYERLFIHVVAGFRGCVLLLVLVSLIFSCGYCSTSRSQLGSHPHYTILYSLYNFLFFFFYFLAFEMPRRCLMQWLLGSDEDVVPI